jgi:hypothetical protein
MGAGLVLRVYEGPYAGLSYPAMVMLTRMAVSALDCDPEPRYWAGWQPLAIALRLKGKDASNRRNVRKYVRELHDAGAVTLIRKGNIHGASTYRLWLDMPAPREARGEHAGCLLCQGPVDNHPLAVDNPQSRGNPRGVPQTPLEHALEGSARPPRGVPQTPLIRRKRSTRDKEYYGQPPLRLVDNPRSA